MPSTFFILPPYECFALEGYRAGRQIPVYQELIPRLRRSALRKSRQ